MEQTSANKITLYNYWVAFLAFFVAVLLGVYQVAERTGYIPEFLETPTLYFASVSTHGVLMGFVLTTFVIMGFGYHTATRSLNMPLWSSKVAWLGFIVAIVGVLMAASQLLTGNASVLFTFYPPLAAHPLFYLGATLLVVGSWFWCLQMIVMTMKWKKANPGQPVPLAQFGNTANAIMWLWTSLGVAAEILLQILPWTLGIIETIDVQLARVLFSWTLHAIVYFWLFPAYIALYTIVPKLAGGRLFSDEMGRISFILLLVVSVPIGMHHLYMDPAIGAGWKFLHMVGTLLVMLPTLLTGFTVLASLELAGRLRGGTGLLGWIGKVNWKDPLVLAAGLGLLMLTFGGFGGAVNASYAMNVMVHNTQWVTGHFHLIFGGTVVIIYIGTAYHFWPQITGKQLAAPGLARMQLWLWFIGMLVLTLPWHVIGALGQPRRISTNAYDTPLVQAWAPYELAMVVGGLILLVSAILLVYVLLKSQLGSAYTESREMHFATPVHPVVALPKVLNSFAFWNLLILVYLVVSYGYPIAQFFMIENFGATPWGV